MGLMFPRILVYLEQLGKTTQEEILFSYRTTLYLTPGLVFSAGANIHARQDKINPKVNSDGVLGH